METFRNNKTPRFTCVKCDFVTHNRKDYNRHLLTRKHVNGTNGNAIHPPIFVCGECSKSFNTRSGLWKHTQKCADLPLDPPSSVSTEVDSSLVLELLKQNNEFKNLMIEQHKQIQEQNKQMIELANKSGNTTNNTTNNTNNTINNNNKFNLNVFLNETCKDAINLNDFIQSIELTISDFINTGEVGYVRVGDRDYD